MPTGELDGEAPSRPFRGFSSNADDTPRSLGDAPDYDDFDEVEADPVFEAFEPARGDLAFTPRDAWEEPEENSHPFSRIVGLGLAVLLAAGVGFALTRGPWFSRSPPAVVAQPALKTALPVGPSVHMAALAPPAMPVLSPAKPAPPGRTPSAAPSPPPPPVHVAQIGKPPPRFVDREVSSDASVSAAAPALAALPPAPAPIGPSFDCQRARSRAQQMVCGDPRLAAADRRISLAYAAALAAAAGSDELRSEQSDWLDIREDAARYSARAVLNIYKQRTRELEAITAEFPR